MKLKDFLSKYGFLYDDFGAIVAWAKHNKYEPELIELISKLAKKLVEDKHSFEFRVREWDSMAYAALHPEITEDLDFTRAINMVRLAYLSYSGSQFVNIINEILISRNIKMEDIKSMHPDIYNKYVEYERYGVHEKHCCPKHGCKYAEGNCPVINNKTIHHNQYCEDCEMEDKENEE